jgi:hypothetical protein
VIKDRLGPTPSHKASSVFELGCGTHPLQSARQYPLKEKHAMGGRVTELLAPTYGVKGENIGQMNVTPKQI